MADNRNPIAHLLDEKDESPDHSLRAHSLKRATKASVPRTLTPYEWEQWYAQYGVPESHIMQRKASGSWWRRLLSRKPQNPSN
jgi:hypothetical protein